ncbi:MAG: hypothetical protein V7641_2296 [Blastocatellia bacterium]
MTLKPPIVFLMLLVMLIAVAPVAALQDSAKKEEEAKAREERRKKALAVIDEIIKDAGSLRLPENRLRLLVQTANAVWPFDEKRARILFKSAQESLKELQAALDDNDPQYANLEGLASQLRSEMLYALAQHDPELALEVLHATGQNSAGQLTGAQASFDAQMELQLAQALAAKDATKALELAEHGLANGVSQEVLNIISTLSVTNRDAAQKLFDEMLARLRTENYATNPTAAYVALNLLQRWIQRHNASDVQTEPQGAGIQQLNFSEQAARDLCNTILHAILDNSTSASTSGRAPWGNAFDLLRQLQPMLPAIEKLVPSQAAMLQGRLAEMQRFVEMQNGPWAKVQEMINTAPVNDLLTAAGNSPPDVRNHLLQSAAWKAFNEGNSDLARQIIQEKITDPRVRQDMQANIDRQSTERLINEGKLAEARMLLMRLSSAAERVTYLVRLATTAMDKGDKNEAQQLLNEAQAQVSNRAENYQILYAQLEIANLLRSLDPPKGYTIIESAIDRLNELSAAAVTLNGFDVQQYFRNNEFVLSNGNPLNQLLQQISSHISGVAEKDADRARAMAERLERLEMKTWVFLTIVPVMLGDSDESKSESLHLAPRRFYPSTPRIIDVLEASNRINLRR